MLSRMAWVSFVVPLVMHGGPIHFFLKVTVQAPGHRARSTIVAVTIRPSPICLTDRWSVSHEQASCIPPDGPLEVSITDFGGQVQALAGVSMALPVRWPARWYLSTLCRCQSQTHFLPPCPYLLPAGGVPAYPPSAVL
jgi:hypothetical protein